MRTLVALLGMLLIMQMNAQAQQCAESGTRILHVYDADTLNMWPIPVADHDSIVNFANALSVAGLLADYYRTKDTLRDCVLADSKSLGAQINAEVDVRHPDLLLALMRFQDWPPSSDETNDYEISGLINPMPTHFELTFWLSVARTGETLEPGHVKAQLAYTPSGDPQQVVQTIVAAFGPLYARMMEFEKQKRDQGPPYAITPKITITPATRFLEINHVTSVHVVVTDCDDEPLKGRRVTLAADEGTLSETSVTTDDQGTADVLFTAGSTPTIAVIVGNLSYKTGYGKASQCQSDPAAISIKPPADSWHAEVSFSQTSRDYTTMTADAGPRQWQRFQTNDDIRYTTWLKADVVHVYNESPYVNFFTFQSKSFSRLKLWANETGSQRSEDSYYGDNGGYDNNRTQRTSATATGTPVPKINLNIGQRTCAFSISGITASQTGEGQTDNFAWGAGISDRTVTPLSIDPSTGISISVQGPTRDSVYTLADVDDYGSSSTAVTQRFYWNGKDTCIMSQTRHGSSHSQLALSGIVSTDEGSTDLVVSVKMFYNGGTNGVKDLQDHAIPSTFSLSQNYPNPFNPSTTIRYGLPQRANVSMIVYNTLGQLVAQLVSGEQEAGYHDVSFDGSGLSSGVYFYRLQAGDFVSTKKWLLLR